MAQIGKRHKHRKGGSGSGKDIAPEQEKQDEPQDHRDHAVDGFRLLKGTDRKYQNTGNQTGQHGVGDAAEPLKERAGDI